MNKYDWSNVPKEVNWIATDADCVSNGFSEKPVIFDLDMWAINEKYEVITLDDLPLYHGNWQDSLEERPK